MEQLERVDLSMSETNIKLAFWINVYNSLVMHVIAGYSTVVTVILYTYTFNALSAYIDLHIIRLQAYLAYGIPNSSLKRMALFHKVKKIF